MADTMQFNLVSPERSLASMAATAVKLPGSEGDMTAMPDHAPVITTLRPGVVRVESPEGDAEFMVTGGFAEINATSTSILAERALPVGEVTSEILDEIMLETQKAREAAEAEEHDMLSKVAAELEALGQELGITVKGVV
ncbi:MAG TPA: F0F1 ATP synthase subunit epsilon [Aliiroseovarius sp.]|nr:F0F1 ATP synthase subunit epsilon [Aliiroseovarius sp.]